MITRKELGYVSAWANRTPHPGIEYAKTALEKLKEAYDSYNKFYAGKEYDIVLSNGEELLFEILNKNLCHMLGVDSKNLNDEYFQTFRRDVLNIDGNTSAYNLLGSIIANGDDIIKYEIDTKKRALNYYRIMIKCNIFEKLSDFSKFNFGVINFDKDVYNSTGKLFNGNSEKLLYVQSNEGVAPYFMMGILPSREPEKDKFAVETLIAPTNVKDFFQNQEVVIPTQIIVTDDRSMNKKEATPSEKIALLNQYKAIINDYKLPNRINIYGDYESMLSSQAKVRKREI